MSQAVAVDAQRSPIETARIHALFRFGVGVTFSFILAELMGWSPTFLPPVLFAVLITSLPVAPPLKMGMVLVLVMACAALVGFMLPSLLRGSPQVLVGAIAVIIFLAFTAIAGARAKLPATLLLISISTVPIIAMIAPALADVLPVAMVRGMAVAILVLWCVHAIWPRVVPRAAPPGAAPVDSPIKTALVGTAVVMPVMLIYLLFGLADALPVLVTVVMLVTTFEPRQGAMQSVGMILGNLIGGLIGLVAFSMLAIAPSLPTLAVITFLIATAFAIRIDKGGPAAGVALVTCNSAMIIFSTAIANPSSSSGIWATRLAQFAIAGLYAIGMMTLVWRKK